MTTMSIMLIGLTAGLGFLALGLSVLILAPPRTSDGKSHRRSRYRFGQG